MEEARAIQAMVKAMETTIITIHKALEVGIIMEATDRTMLPMGEDQATGARTTIQIMVNTATTVTTIHKSIIIKISNTKRLACLKIIKKNPQNT